MELQYDLAAELKAFDDTKAGVKGLVDSGISTLPRIFVHPKENTFTDDRGRGQPPCPILTETTVPTINLQGRNGLNQDSGLRSKVVNEIGNASSTWGFFQVINHGIPNSLLDEILESNRKFYEQDLEIKKQYYNRENGVKKVVYNSNFDLLTRNKPADWRDTILCYMHPDPPTKEEMPEACGDTLVKYSAEMMELGRFLFGLLSEALGLREERLVELGCADGMAILCHYYPACPQPEVTLGASKHNDDDFITILLQDKEIGGLQVLRGDEWFDVPIIDGALVVNIGDLLQLISNDKFKSVEHRVLSNKKGPRVSVASFFTTYLFPSSRIFRPIEELLSEDNPPLYRSTTIVEYDNYFIDKGLNGEPKLLQFKIK